MGVRVGDDGHVTMAADQVRAKGPPPLREVVCQHPNDHGSVLATEFHPMAEPNVLFTHRSTPRYITHFLLTSLSALLKTIRHSP